MPAAAPVKAPAARPGDALLCAFIGTIEPVAVTTGYRVVLLVVALAMLVLPLIYLGLIGGVGWAVWWHATENLSIFEGRGNGKGKLLFYAAPLIMGGLLLLFMVKPLFARRGEQSDTIALEPQREPLLFAFVARICAIVGAPTPRRIHVDCQVNASASFRRGALSLFGDDLVLTIGLPLAGGMDVRQFAGVLAHEFGHFAQGGGMRLSFIIRTINAWFSRVVYERDTWDKRLIEWQRSDTWLYVLVGLARVLIWCTRRILWVLMMVGHALSCAMSRQMEFDADRYEARLAGCDQYEGTAKRLRVLSVASNGAYADLRRAWQTNRLGDDLPALVLANVRQIPDEVRAKVLAAIGTEKTGWFDTHPCDLARIASAKREATPGVFRASGPGSQLFRDFPALCRQATLHHYRGMIGPQVGAKNLVSTGDLVAEVDGLEEGRAAARRFFGGAVGQLVPLALTRGATPVVAVDSLPRLGAARDLLAKHGVDITAISARLATADSAVLDASRARELLNARLSVDAQRFRLPAATPEAVRKAASERGQECTAAAAALAPYATAARERLLLALGLPGGEAERAKAEPLLVAYASLATAWTKLDALRRAYQQLDALGERLQGENENKTLIDALLAALARARTTLVELKMALGSAAYPFAHADQQVTLDEWAVPRLPADRDLGATFDLAGSALSKLYDLHQRLLGELALLGEQAERSAGLAPLPESSAP